MSLMSLMSLMMRTFGKRPIAAVSCLIVALAATEAAVTWSYLKGMRESARQERMARLEAQRPDAPTRPNPLTFARDAASGRPQRTLDSRRLPPAPPASFDIVGLSQGSSPERPARPILDAPFRFPSPQ